MKKTIALIAVFTLLCGCGIKRPLELQGHEKHKPHSETLDTSDANNVKNASPVK